MSIPAIAAGAVKALPYAMMIPGLLKKFYKSKAFWPTVTTAGGLGMVGLSEKGKKDERKFATEQIALQKLMQEASAEATKRLTEESRSNTERYIKELVKAKEGEREQEREAMLMQAFAESQNRNMTMALSAIQGMSARPTTVPRTGGFISTLRSNI